MTTFSARTELAARWVLARLGVVPAQFYRWQDRYGQVNAHNGQIPREHWLTPRSGRRFCTITTPMRRRDTGA